MRFELLLAVFAITALTACETAETSPAADAGDPGQAEPEPDPDPPSNGDGTLATDGSHNILLIIADDLGVDNVSGYGEHADSASTPTIDNLAASGTLFRNAWTNPMCSPSRASLYTGRHAYNHGVLHPSEPELDTDEQTFAEALQAAGYQTALFGKWHLGEDDGLRPIDQGFDFFSGAQSNLDDYFEWTRTTMDAADGSSVDETIDRYATGQNVDDAEDWLEGAIAAGDPWMAVMAFNAPHSPFHVPPKALFSGVELSGSVGTTCNNNSDDSRSDCYRAAAEAMDSKLSELLTFLDEQGALDDTLVVFIGDNGTPGNVIIDDGVFSTEHGKTTVYEGGVNVPLIVYGPSIGVQQGVESDELVMGLDLFATFVEVGGATADNDVDAISLVRHVTGDTLTESRPTLYTELYSENESIDRWTITNGTAKYINIEGTEECYNLSRDAGESDEKYADDGPVTDTCDELKNQRPCLADGVCPG